MLVALAALDATPGVRAADEVADAADPARVIVLANERDRESVSLALFYASRRRIPDANVVRLPLPADETITWEVFVRELFNPLQDHLVAEGWIDGLRSELLDDAGRRRTGVLTHRIAHLVVCRGVPLAVAHDPRLLPPETAARMAEPFRTNQAAVDGELALLAAPSVMRDVNGPVANPLFRVARPDASQVGVVVRVARLDGPSLAACERMIESALVAEERGLAGRAYVDRGGPVPHGDEWLGAAAERLRALDFDVQMHDEPAVMPTTARCDAPALYFGWYAGDLTGPFALPEFRFPPGAIALHIFSFSAATLRSETRGWVGPLVARGAAVAFGNVHEPYLELTHRPELLVTALSEGRTLGEAACYALPVLGWQSIVVGDPLYRPFALSLDEQLARLPDRLDPEASYVVLRQANRLARVGRTAEIEPWLTAGSRSHPGLAASLRLAQERRRADDLPGARRALALFTFVRAVRSDEIAVAAEAAQLLAALDEPREAVAVYAMLLEQTGLDAAWRRALLIAGRDTARQANDLTRHREWVDALRQLGVSASE